MKKINKLFFIIPAVVILAAAGWFAYRFSQTSSTEGAVMSDKNILIAYYSYSGNTESIAKKIQAKTGGDLFEIKTVTPYPKDYNTVVEQAQKEKQADFYPELQEKVADIAKYDVVFLGTPVWWYTMAPPVKTFIKEKSLDGKTVIPFCTHGGGGASATFSDMAKLAPNAKVLEGIEIYERGNASTDNELNKWIEKTLK